MPANKLIASIPVTKARTLSYQELDILHCLRGFCAFYVVVYHAKYILWSGGQEYLNEFPRSVWSAWQYIEFFLDMLSSAGYEMVIFFFVLSGFFIRYAQQRKYRATIAFYLNRITRIYPPFIVSVVLAILILAVIIRWLPQVLTFAGNRELNTSLITARNELYGLTLLGAVRALCFLPVKSVYIGYNTVYWSLLPEALFYLIVPFAFLRVRVYYILSTVLYVLGIIAIKTGYSLEGVYSFAFTHNFYFAVGALFYDIVVRTEWLRWFRNVSGWLLMSLTVLSFALLVVLAVLKFKIASVLLAMVIAVLAISLLLAGRVPRHNILLRIFHKIGVFSFSLYLYHYPLLLLCAGLLTYSTGEIIFYARYYWLAVPLVTLICYIIYWFTERVAVSFLRKI